MNVFGAANSTLGGMRRSRNSLWQVHTIPERVSNEESAQLSVSDYIGISLSDYGGRSQPRSQNVRTHLSHVLQCSSLTYSRLI